MVDAPKEQLYRGSGQESSGVSVFSTGASDAAEIKKIPETDIICCFRDFLCTCIFDGFLRTGAIFRDFRNR